MELRYYWRVLVRRRNIIRNTFLIVAVIGLLSVAYGYYTAQYVGETKIAVAVQKNPDSRASVVDPAGAAFQNTDQVINQLVQHAGTTDYFKAVSAELRQKYGINMDYKAVAQTLSSSPGGVFRSGDAHDVIIQASGSSNGKVTNIVTAAGDQLRAYVLVYHNQLNPSLPAINVTLDEQPIGKHVSLSKPLIDFLLRAALGLVAGIILAYLFEYLDDTVQDENDVRHWMNLPTLAVIPGGQSARRARSA